ncbi:heavy metal-associated domain-containing protein [Clostridium beijerinckii]|jgi:plastocyanin domain-containing protein/sulfite exporter TauE/SafE/copper chaperone CopZ|uniref:Heavy metal-associated domain-containing protein n=3 Tax=Clostridium TaxID=1485 RepID=A0AAV3VUF8_9CLOT|nr:MULTISPECIES: sulfite exporter TauE/SafE family protein [Clostridium]ALB47274.1 heavy metal transport/detoxification protein [Clostridium beijerinckii NRRL B-598]MCI1477459.1 sulfite exporter TauE/SafE family protein [Clostridium beijerinckii]MCI1577236.1 sulfite exporter TauE/SafE family protein [Clostridium beijerinckii]MCI1582718.1 sulfite exporter TauE/SafE family protein [Clostridium beijerinckii]MCI1621418.1 sulfite exporter TauE/SafE family protein [Clostridium beijerinckii]
MGIKRENIKVYDMTCTSCENRVERALMKIDGVLNAMASYSAQQVTVEYDSKLCSMEQLKEAINKAGYSTKNSVSLKFAGFLVIAAAVLLLGNSTAGFDMSAKLNNASYVVLFIVGMLTSIHCVGMCGGIMLTQSLSKNSIIDEKENRFKALKPSILYNAGRVTSYTIIGGIVGALGSVLSLSLNVKAGLQIFAGLFMVIMGLNMTGFSLFRKLNIKLPWSSCKIKNKPKAPFLVGMLNGLMPCGPLQTMQLYALGTGSAINGAISMFLFSLGTVPLMLIFGAVSGFLSKGYTKQLLKFSGILVVVLGLIMGNRGLALAGVGIPNASTLAQNFSGDGAQAAQSNIGKATIENGVQVIRMTADNNGYTPNAFYVQKDMPVKWIITGNQINSCNNAVVVPSLNIQKTLKSGENVIEFTPKDGDINFSCWMGMIRGIIKVTDNLDSVDTSKADSSIPAPSSGMSCCTGTSASNTPQAPSIYGNDLSKVSTDRLIKKANISGDTQNLSIKGTGYEFEPLVAVLQKGIKTKLSVDLNSFDKADGVFIIYNADSGDEVTTFTGRKDVVNVEFNIDKSGTYVIVKDNVVAMGIEVTDSLKTVNLDEVRKKLINE